jgi:hypothetical protein
MGKVHEPFNDDSVYYSDRKYVSNSMLGKLMESPHLFDLWMKGQYEYPKNPNFVVGRYVHTMVLEPNKVEDFHVSSLKTRTSGGFKEDIFKYGYDWVVTKNEHDMAVSVQKRLEKIEKINDLLIFAEKEVPFISEYEGIPIKGKVDAITEIDGLKVVIDLKTTGKEVTKFPSSARSFDYDRQAYFYLKLTGADLFMFIPVEKSFPYTPALYTASDDFVARGKYKFEKAMSIYKHLFVDGNYNDEYLIEEYL